MITYVDSAALMDGRFRLRATWPGVSASLDDRALVFEKFADARRAARLAAALRADLVCFVVQYGAHVWASDGRPCPRRPDEF